MKTNPVASSVSLRIALLFVLLLAACSEKSPEPKSVAVPIPPISAAPAAEPIPVLAPQPTKSGLENDLATRVKNALAGDKELAWEGIDVTVTRSVAHLWGTVGSVAERKRAEERAMSVNGITSVDDKLAVVKGS